MEPNVRHTVLVVSPLVSLMMEQVSQLRNIGIAAYSITKASDMTTDDVKGKYSR